jgi:hypothetical protein
MHRFAVGDTVDVADGGGQGGCGIFPQCYAETEGELGVRQASLMLHVRPDSTNADSSTQPTVSRLVKAMSGVVVGCVYFNRMSEFLKANGSIDDQTFRTACKIC